LFMVGGVVGVNVASHKHPENLYFSGKIYAPYAQVSPCLASVQDNNLDWNHVINYYGGEAEDLTDEVERSISSSWAYGDYKIGLSSAFDSPVTEGSNHYIGTGASKRYINYDPSEVETIDGNKYINADKLLHHNRYGAHPRRNSTVLWWTRTDNLGSDTYASVAPSDPTDWTKGDQNIFPQRNKNVTTYPDYYMYYEQGVNRGTKHIPTATDYETGIEKNIENLMGKSGAKKLVLTLTDLNKGQRGFDPHTFSVEATGDDAAGLTYQWYVDGVAKGTSNTQSVDPSFSYDKGYQDGTHVFVVAKKDATVVAQATGYIPVARLRYKDSESAGTKTEGVHTYVKDPGTKDHPYLIKNEKELRLLSEQLTQPGNLRQEYVYFTGFNNNNKCYFRNSVGNNASQNPVGYNQAYYELDGNVELNTSYDFMPIGPNSAPVYNNDGTYGNRNNNFSFVGSFDGKGYKIKGLRQKWYAGYVNENGSTYAWGLFSCIGSTGQYYKVGETTASNAAVRNLIIDDAVLTHDTSNTSFYYNNGSASSRGNRCFVGPLAGIAGNYSTIENISVINSTITDDGSSEYELAAQRLSIGGVVGRATAGITDDNQTLANAKMRYLSSDANIDIQHAEFTNVTSAEQTQYFLIGGIVGSLHSNAAQNTVPFPTPSFYSGKVRARNAIIGPIFAYAAWSGNTNKGYLDFARHFTAKTSAAATFDATGMYYSSNKTDGADQPGFRIYNGTTYKAINDEYPSVTTDWGDRNIKGVSTHTNSNVYTESPRDLYEYQGVNQGNFETLLSPTVTTAFNDYSSLLTDEQTLLEDYKWAWSTNAASQPVVTIGEVSGLYVTAKDTYDGTTVTSHVLEATVNSASEGARTYQWYRKMRTETSPGVWKNDTVAIDDATSASYTATPSVHNQYIIVRATINGESAYSDPILIEKNQNITATIDKEAGVEPVKWIMKATVATDAVTPLDS
ncbi:MAG: hypothetical protein J6W24_06460, partial [Prevotella sp.]|nr:hypothetical protein [Prevotella sp.]